MNSVSSTVVTNARRTAGIRVPRFFSLQTVANKQRNYLKELIRVLKDTTVHTIMIMDAIVAITTFAAFSALEMRFPMRIMYSTDGSTDATSTEENYRLLIKNLT